DPLKLEISNLKLHPQLHYLCTMRIFLIGYMGSGKTTLGRSLSAILGYRITDLDEEFESRYKVSIQDFFSRYGEAPFRQLEQKLLIEYIDDEDVVISTGGGTPCYANNMDLMLKHGITVYLKMNPQELTERLSVSVRKRPLIMMKQGEDLFAHVSNHLMQRENYYNRAHIIMNGSHPDARRLAQEIRSHALFIP
ncbi:MAG TPA: shikimate kinase, partial [Bacteroidales bacterium]|nr:shikimate kinase [Bacteroidales bacterium]